MTEQQERESEDPFADLPDEPAPLAPVPPPQTKEDLPEQVKARFRQLEDGLMEEALTVLGDALKFRDIEPGAKEPPVEWDHLPPAEQLKRLRMAQMAYLSKKEAPVGFEMAKSVYTGLVKARAMEKASSGPRTLNVQVAVLAAPLPKFDEIVVHAGDD